MILCCGEALIDMIPVDGPGGRQAWRAVPGGALFNCAIALGRLGAPAGLLTGLSSDSFGRLLKDALTHSSADYSIAIATDRKTALAFVHLQDGNAHYTFYDEGTAALGISIEDVAPLSSTVTTLVFGGISLVGEPCASTMEAVQVRDREGRVVMLDPNVRPSFIDDPTAFRERVWRMMRRSHIVKVSDDDLAWLYPDERSPEGGVRAILDMGPDIVLHTKGSVGATATLSSGQMVSVPAAPVEVVDTVGAGDTFNAGVLAALFSRGALTPANIRQVDAGTLREALVYGVKAAAFSVSKRGAEPPWKSDIV
ncbi:MAG: carbohydrate kinase [Pseudomonadota bacterium]